MNGILAPMMDAVEATGRILGRRARGSRYQGTVPSVGFFHAANRGDPKALTSLADLGYKGMWESRPELRQGMVGEIVAHSRNPLKPRGILTGSSIYGVNRARGVISGAVGPLGLAFAAADVAFSIATAPRGELAAKVTSSLGGQAGALVGGAVGAAMLGLPGELIGGYIGYELGSLPGKALSSAVEYGRNMRRLHTGGDFQDSEAALTMRRRAAAELSTSLLNARQYLGKEAVLMHQ